MFNRLTKWVRGLIEDARTGVKFVAWDKARWAWSQRTFGSRADRGPMGPVLHLQKEVQEVLDDLADGETDKANRELVDCLFLTLDAMNRAGLSLADVTGLAEEKLRVNEARVWPTPTSDQPVEHVRED